MIHLATDAAKIADLVAAQLAALSRPFIIALDGRSGAGKSTLASTLTVMLDATMIEGDDFYAGGTALRGDSAASRASACIDWTRQRAVLETLKAGHDANWRAFDWDAFDGRLRDEPTRIGSKPVVILEGVYSARPELADLIDMRVAVSVPEEVRLSRLIAREGEIGPWERQWHEAEEFYFSKTMPMSKFDLVFDNGAA